MSDVLAVVADEPAEDGVLRLAEHLGHLLAGRMRRFPVAAREQREFADSVVAEIRDESVGVAVLRVDPDPDRAFWEIIRRSRKPVVALPRGVEVGERPISRVLLPLDGTVVSARAVTPAVQLLLDAGTEVIATHVFDTSTVPAFWDQAAHGRPAFSDEFVRRHLPGGVRLALRRGSAAEQVLAESELTGADLLLLGWAQLLTPGRAGLVRRVLAGPVPVMLVGTGSGRSDDEEGTFGPPPRDEDPGV
jgi:nucleotide-binding universal stress UspA family protein